MQNWNLVPFFGLNQRYFVLFLSANSKISHINSRNKCVKNFNTNWNGTPCKQRKYAVLFPHAWECSTSFPTSTTFVRPFPTCVGVFPTRTAKVSGNIAFSHMRGSVPEIIKQEDLPGILSPHAWECSSNIMMIYFFYFPFPTYVGAFL